METACRRRLAAAVLLVLPLLAARPDGNRTLEEISFRTPVVYPDTPENRRRAEALLTGAALQVDRRYSRYIRLAEEAASARASYLLEARAILQEDSPVLALGLRCLRDGRTAELSLLGDLLSDRTDDRAGFESAGRLAAAVFALWGSLNDHLPDPLRPPPLYVDALPAAAVGRTLLPRMPAVLTPLSAAVTPGGSLLVGFSMLCAELGPAFQVIGQPGRVLYDEGNYNFAAEVAVTPGGTIFLKPSLGREIYRLTAGSSRPVTWRVGVDLFGPFAALPDGSVVVLDQQNRRALRVEAGRRRELKLYSGPYSAVSALAVGPEGNIWVYDAAERSIRIHSPLGELIDTVMPLMDAAEAGAVVSLSVYRDGRFVLYSAGAVPRLSCFTRLGVPLWRLAALPGPQAGAPPAPEEPLPRSAAVALDSGSGCIYLADRLGQRIVKLLDTAYASDHGIVNPGEEALIAWNRRRAGNPDSPEAGAGMARFYEEAGAPEMARLHWQAALDLDPAHPLAATRLAALDIALLKQSARRLQVRALELLDNLGPESARGEYSQALMLYERILSLDAADEGAAAGMRELKEMFRERESAAEARARPLEITELRSDDLFPSLMHTYRRSPPVLVTVRNVSGGELRDLEAGVFIKRLMDFPQAAPPLPRLPAGDSATFALPVLFNPGVLELQEDLPVQALIELTCFSDAGPQTVRATRSLTVHRRTALVWDDSARLSSFITPNEEIVTRFAHRVAASGGAASTFRMSAKLLRAARICDALGVYGIAYIEDPDSPISRVLGRENLVDTVRFPRTTLLIRSGDCDDSTALLASLLESGGISTAIMTSPGHVFLAFNSEEPEENLWLFADDRLITLPRGGELWIPLETTVLAQGFLAAWREASRLVAAYSPNRQVEFLPLEDQRAAYPPLPLPESGFTVIEPAGAEVDRLHARTLEELETSLHRRAAAALKEQAAAASGRQRARLLNRLGILHAVFGRDEEALRVFASSRREFPDYIPPAVNLAHLYLSREETEAARSVLEAALTTAPDSVPVNLLLAESWYRQGQYRRIAPFFNKVRAASPELARRYAYLGEAAAGADAGIRGAGGGRGAADAPRPPPAWEQE